MNGPLEKFILENREQFDGDTPDPGIWEKIREKMEPDAEKEKPIRSMPFKRWLAAAAAVLLVGVSAVLYYSMHQNNKVADPVAGTNAKPAEPGKVLPVTTTPADTAEQIAKTTVPVQQKITPGEKSTVVPEERISPEESGNKEMYYYSKLIEIKHEELKTLEKDEPLLYRQFSGDVRMLDSVYHSLKTQLPNNSNREQVIEAMISNLQLQIRLLNKQLDIIKQIKHSKKTAYEKAYKSI